MKENQERILSEACYLDLPEVMTMVEELLPQWNIHWQLGEQTKQRTIFVYCKKSQNGKLVKV